MEKIKIILFKFIAWLIFNKKSKCNNLIIKSIYSEDILSRWKETSAKIKIKGDNSIYCFFKNTDWVMAANALTSAVEIFTPWQQKDVYRAAEILFQLRETSTKTALELDAYVGIYSSCKSEEDAYNVFDIIYADDKYCQHIVTHMNPIVNWILWLLPTTTLDEFLDYLNG